MQTWQRSHQLGLEGASEITSSNHLPGGFYILIPFSTLVGNKCTSRTVHFIYIFVTVHVKPNLVEA